MISFDQVSLLQEKVESAVQKIVELKAENDALRNKCSELTNALSAKTELLNTLTADEQKIESSIKGALDRLNSIENSILSKGDKSPAPAAQPAHTQAPSQTAPAEKPAAVNQNTTNQSNNQTNNQSNTQTVNAAQQSAKPEQPSQADKPAAEPELDVNTSFDEPDEKEEKFDIF